MDASEIRDASPERLAAWVHDLVRNRVPEAYTLDYKRELNLDLKDTPNNLAKDVAAFANSSGGTLVVGVPEENGVPTGTCGIAPVPGLDERAHNILADSLSPRLPLVAIREVSVAEGAVVYLIAVPESWIGPHMVSSFKDGRFYRRSERRAEPMDEAMVADAYRARAQRELEVTHFLDSPEVAGVPAAYNGTMNFRIAAVPDALVRGRVPIDRQRLEVISALGESLAQTGPWSVAAWGAHSRMFRETDYTYARWYDSGAVVLWSAVGCYPTENRDGVRVEVLPVHHMLETAGGFLKFLAATLVGATGAPSRYLIDIAYQLPHLEVCHMQREIPQSLTPVFPLLRPHAMISLRSSWERPNLETRVSVIKDLARQLGRYFGESQYDDNLLERDGRLMHRAGRQFYEI